MVISKELFETVKGFKIEKFNIVEPYIEYRRLNWIRNTACNINETTLSIVAINDFFFECKAWASDLTYVLKSTINFCDIRKDGLRIPDKSDPNAYDDLHGWYRDINFTANSEQQAVFDACQWILDKGSRNESNN